MVLKIFLMRLIGRTDDFRRGRRAPDVARARQNSTPADANMSPRPLAEPLLDANDQRCVKENIRDARERATASMDARARGEGRANDGAQRSNLKSRRCRESFRGAGRARDARWRGSGGEDCVRDFDARVGAGDGAREARVVWEVGEDDVVDDFRVV